MSHPTSAADLERLVAQVWRPTAAGKDSAAVSWGPPPRGYRVVERYGVFPSRRRARFLIPLGVPAVLRSAFGRHHTTDSTSARLLGHLIAWGSQVPGSDQLLRSRLTMSVPDRTSGRRETQLLLLAHLEAELGAQDLVAVLPVRRVTPNAKPTLRLFSRDGTAVGYVKVGWSPATRRIVDNEAATLRAVHGRLRTLDAPALTAAGDWLGQRFAVAEALPAGVSPWRIDPAAAARHLLDIAASGHESAGPLHASTYAAGVRHRLTTVERAEPEAAAVLIGLLDRLVARDPQLRFGRWHGDWVPWNVGQKSGRLVAWDWEYSAPSVPIGLDLLHWHFQQALPRTGTLQGALAALDDATPSLSSVGVAPEHHGAVGSLYLLEMFTRAAELAAEGSGWNPRIFPAMLSAAKRREHGP